MSFREALIITLAKGNLVKCPQTNVAAYFDEDHERFVVEERFFYDVGDAADEFIKRTGDGLITRTDEEAGVAPERN